MKMFPVSVLSLLVILAAAAEADNYCCTAPQYVISAGQIQGLQLPGSGKAIAQVNGLELAADFPNDRVGEEITSITLGVITKLKVIIDYKKNVMYTIIGQNCTKSEPSGFFEQCVPKTAHYTGSVYLGDNELTMDTFSLYQDVPRVFRGNATLSYTHGSCVLVGAALVGEAQSTSPPIPLVSSTGFGNFTKGISDPSRWFDIPSICHESGFGRFRRSPVPISDDHKEVMQLTSIFNSMMLPAIKKQ